MPKDRPVSEAQEFEADLARLDAEQPGWDRGARVAAARSWLKTGGDRVIVVGIYGEELVAEAERLNASEQTR